MFLKRAGRGGDNKKSLLIQLITQRTGLTTMSQKQRDGRRRCEEEGKTGAERNTSRYCRSQRHLWVT